MPSALSSAPDSLHSDDTQTAPETVAGLPPKSTITLRSSENCFYSLPTHRRANTEHIARPPLVKQGLDDARSNDDRRPNNRSTASWTDTFPKKQLEARARILSGWFQGKSEPVGLGVKMRPDGTPNSAGTEAFRPAAASVTQAPTSRFSLFGLRRQAESKQEPPEPAEDEFLNLDVTAALSLPESGATSNGAALETLRDHAGMVLHRMQQAYKQRTLTMYQALADKNEEQEELGDTRALVNHLKMQLDGMAAQVLEQEKAMRAMADELEQERRMRSEEDPRARSRTMRATPADDELPSLVLHAPRRGGKRASHSTFTSDSGFESGDESVADSTFSQREGVESPASTFTAPSPNMSQVALSAPPAAPTPTIQKNPVSSSAAPSAARSSTYDRVVKGLASTRLGGSVVGNSSPCGNCHGVPASEAWSVMGVLKDENRGLKARLGELELVIDDCLGLVGP